MGDIPFWFWVVIFPFLLLLKFKWSDRCPECGEECTPLEADCLFGQPCYACQDEVALLREIKLEADDE